jgi:hypothetical protein
MKFNEFSDALIESTEDAVDFLKKYVDNPINRWLSAERFDNILSYFPYQGGKLYRGMNFLTQESYEKFLADLQDGVVKTSSITSWTRSVDTASQFAITRPTYYLNAELAAAETAREKAGEHMIGYRGVILSTTVPAGVGIDVNQSGVGAEDEIILPAGDYKIQIAKEFKPFAQQMAGRDPNDILLTIDQKKFQSDSETQKMFQYLIRNNEPDKFSPASKHKIFQLVYNRPYVPGNIVYDDRMTWTNYFYVTPGYNFRSFGYVKYLLDQDLKKLRKDADNILVDIINTLKPKLIEAGISVADAEIIISNIDQVLKMASPGAVSKYTKFIKTIVAPEKQKLDLAVQDINKITDPKQKSDAVRDYKEKITRLIQFASQTR